MFLDSILEGWKASTADRRRKQAFDHLEDTPFLHSSDYLNEMLSQAKEKEDYESILEHMYKHGAYEVDSYKEIEEKIMKRRYWDD